MYAYVLNNDESVVQIADIDAKLGGAMALDYDTYGNVLWVAADDGYGNRMAQIVLNGTENPKITHVSPASGVNTSANNEGFAIADATYTVNGQRPVYRFCDGVTSGALTIGSIDCSYTPSGKPDIDKPVAPNDPSGQPAVPSEKTDGSAADSGAAANAPGTGDESPVGVWAGLLILSAGTLVAVLILQRRKHIR